jgi:hypothetical protein
LALGAPQQVGFGDATDADIAEIRAGTYLETYDDNPQYNFNYKISDETEQTYMAMDETRNGESVTGSYSYVDPTGALVVVNYVAGPEGYSETREVQDGFVQIRPRPVKTVQAVAAAPAASFTSSNAAFSNNAVIANRPTQGSFTVLSPSSSSSSSSSLQSDIVSQVVSQVQPLISQTVSSAVAGARRPAPLPAAPAPVPAPVPVPAQVDIVSQVVSEIQPLLSQSVASAVAGGSGSGRFSAAAARPAPVAAAPAPRPAASAPRLVAQASRSSGSVTDLFGSSGDFNVRFNTPSFKIEY